MSELVKIRQARRGDQQALAVLLKELGYDNAADSNTQLWVLNHPEIDVFVAVDHLDRPIGFISLSHRPQLRLRGRIATIDELVVAEAWRNKGVGTKLIGAAVDRAKALSAKRVDLLTYPDRASGQRSFFKRSGFEEVDSALMRLVELEKR
ncbi:MAG: GNAT family N-acetyltransferase [Deltaproteobacteria bacterium]|nr:GNAT family N-acetyltransferase [Deltaproteobacteria bacterium]